MNNSTTQNIKLGALLALAASLFYTIMNVFVKLLGDRQTTTTIVFARFAIGLIALLPWFLTDKNLFKVDNKIKVIFRCITSLLVMVCVFYSLRSLPITIVLLLNNTFPLFLPLLAWIMLRVKTSAKIIFWILIGFIGVALVLNPGTSAFNWHSLIALLSGLLAAVALLQIRLLTHSTSAKQIVFYLFAFGTLVTGITLPFSFKTPTLYQACLLIILGLFGAFYQLFLTKALEFAKARIISPIYYSCILFSVLFDWAIWSVKPSLTEFIGMGLIIVGGLLTILMAD